MAPPYHKHICKITLGGQCCSGVNGFAAPALCFSYQGWDWHVALVLFALFVGDWGFFPVCSYVNSSCWHKNGIPQFIHTAGLGRLLLLNLCHPSSRDCATQEIPCLSAQAASKWFCWFFPFILKGYLSAGRFHTVNCCNMYLYLLKDKVT